MKKATELTSHPDIINNVAATSSLFTIGSLSPEENHQRMVDKGFWPKVEYLPSGAYKVPPRDMEEVFMLIISELSEAVEANRIGRSWENISHKDIDRLRVIDELNSEWVESYEKLVKDCDLEELADVMIRIMDSVGYYLSIGAYLTPTLASYCTMSDIGAGSFCAACFGVAKTIASMDLAVNSKDVVDANECLYSLGIAFCKTKKIIELHGGDVEFLVEAKAAYNKQRKALHGKKY